MFSSHDLDEVNSVDLKLTFNTREPIVLPGWFSVLFYFYVCLWVNLVYQWDLLEVILVISYALIYMCIFFLSDKCEHSADNQSFIVQMRYFVLFIWYPTRMINCLDWSTVFWLLSPLSWEILALASVLLVYGWW